MKMNLTQLTSQLSIVEFDIKKVTEQAMSKSSFSTSRYAGRAQAARYSELMDKKRKLEARIQEETQKAA